MRKLPSRHLHTVTEAVAFFNEVEHAIASVVHDAALQIAASKGASVYLGFEADFMAHLIALIDLIAELRLRTDHLEHLEGAIEKSPTRPEAGILTGGAVRDARKRALRDFSALASLLDELRSVGEVGGDSGAVSGLISYLKKPTPYR